MTGPRRVRVEGDLWHGRVPDGAVYVGRAAPGLRRSPWHNPHKVGGPVYAWDDTPIAGETVRDATHAVALFAADLRKQAGHGPGDVLGRIRRDLAGRDLACWCRPDQPCHADVLLRVAAGGQP